MGGWTVKHEWVYLRPCENGIEQKKSVAGEDFIAGAHCMEHRREFFAQMYTVHLLDPRRTEQNAKPFFTLAERLKNAVDQNEFVKTLAPGFFENKPEWLTVRSREWNRAGVHAQPTTGLQDGDTVQRGLPEAPSSDGESLGLANGVSKFSKQTDGLQKIDPEQALKDIERILGKDFDARIEKSLGGKV